MKAKFTPYILLLFFIASSTNLYSQKYHLKTSTYLKENNKELRGVNYKEFLDSEEALRIELDNLKSKLELKGFLNVQLDSIMIQDSIYNALFILGEKSNLIHIMFPNDLIGKEGLKNNLKSYTVKISNSYAEVKFESVPGFLNTILRYYEEQGMSFSEVSLKEISFEKTTPTARLNIVVSQRRTIDKVIVKGYEAFPEKYIRHDLNLKINDVFNEEKLTTASKAISYLQFVEETKSPEVLFTKDSTYIYLYLIKKKSNKFDGVLGFASKENDDGVDFNGYLDFVFNNLFNGGETISLNWKNNGNNSQHFNLSADVPYIFKLPITPKGEFEIFRQDTIYNNVIANFYLSYLINNQNEISAIINSENSNDLLSSSDPDLNVTSYKNMFYGLHYRYLVLNRDPLFLEKFKVNFSALYGNRKSGSVNTSQNKLILQTHYLLTLNLKNYFFIQNQSAFLNSDNYYTNELFRIGGINTIRGFNEESIFASTYSIFNIEYRYKPNNSSYFFTITDFAYVNNEIIDQSTQAYSFGFGYSFITKIGLLNLSYAVGKFADNPFSFSDSKLHLKLISIF